MFKFLVLEIDQLAIYDKKRKRQTGIFMQHDSSIINEYRRRQQIVNFWAIYNRQLLELVRRIPNENLQRECLVGEKVLTLDFLINDYIEHLEHHLRQVVSY